MSSSVAVEEKLCQCSHDKNDVESVCICTDCKCHLRRINPEYSDIIIPIPSRCIQNTSYGVIISTVCFIALYMLLLRPS